MVIQAQPTQLHPCRGLGPPCCTPGESRSPRHLMSDRPASWHRTSSHCCQDESPSSLSSSPHLPFRPTVNSAQLSRCSRPPPSPPLRPLHTPQLTDDVSRASDFIVQHTAAEPRSPPEPTVGQVVSLLVFSPPGGRSSRTGNEAIPVQEPQGGMMKPRLPRRVPIEMYPHSKSQPPI